MLSALEHAGCMVVTGLLDEQERKSISAELAPHMANVRVVEEDDPEQFYPARTRRTTALLTRSNTVAEQLVPHPISTGVCDRFLLPNGEFGYQLHVTAALEVGPGAREQVLHREEDSFTFFPVPRPNLIVASMWAISDFRSDNGATLIVPGSHKWPTERVPESHEIVPAEMPAGSVLFWSGGLLHGAGREHIARLALRCHIDLFTWMVATRRKSVSGTYLPNRSLGYRQKLNRLPDLRCTAHWGFMILLAVLNRCAR